MPDLKTVRELEQLQYSQFLNQLNQEEEQRVAEIKAQTAARGTLQSGGTIRAIMTVRSEKIKRSIDERIRIRRTLAVEFPELGSEPSLTALLGELQGTLVHFVAGVRGLVPSTLANAVNSIAEQEKYRLSAHANRSIEILKREIELNLHIKKPEPATAISVNAPGGAALVNVGVIYGHVQQVIGKVGDEGFHELADRLEVLASAISKSEELGNDRAVYLEQVQFIAEQAAAPKDEQKAGLVTGMFRGLQVGLQGAANLAQLVALLGAPLARHFGFPWPL